MTEGTNPDAYAPARHIKILGVGKARLVAEVSGQIYEVRLDKNANQTQAQIIGHLRQALYDGGAKRVTHHIESLANKEGWIAGPEADASVPQWGELTLRLLLPKKQREAFLGDLEERFHEQVQARGRRGATRWYWIEVIRALYTLVPTSAKAILFAWFWLKFGR